MNKSLLIPTISLIISIFLVSCSNTRYLKEGQTLYAGSKVKIQDDYAKNKKELEKELVSYVRPRENTKVLGMKLKLLAWNLAGEPKKKNGLRAWVRNKWGEEPVYGEEVKTEFNNLVLENQLFHKGFFNAKSSGKKVIENKKAKQVFEVTTGPQYSYHNVNYKNEDTQLIYRKIENEFKNSILKSGQAYNLEQIKTERERLAKILNNDGYYFFNADYIQFLADTSLAEKDHAVDMKLVLRREIMPLAAFHQFRINNITIYPDYNLEDRNLTIEEISRLKSRMLDTVVTDEFLMIDGKNTVKPILFKESILYKKGDLYNENTQNKSLTRLVGTGLFKFVKNDYVVKREQSSGLSSLFDVSYNALIQRGILTTKDPKLDLIYTLTQYPKKKINLETTLFTQDDNRGGARLNFSWRNRNIFKAAEVFSVRLLGGTEIQYGGALRRPNIYNIGIESSLEVPRFIVPFIKIRPTYSFLPKTIVSAKYDFYLMNKIYDIHAASFRYGYNWKEDARKEHRLFPLDFTFVRTDTLAANKDSLSNYNLKNVIFNGVIIGPTYEYTFNSRLGQIKKNNFYFSGLADLGGNLTGLIQGADYTKGKSKIFGNEYAQYVKLQTDFRYYRDFSPIHSIASRLFVGVGIPYGNSSVLPNIKQLFAGGISSLRGFNARMVGPGTFNEKYMTGQQTYVEMLGDIKLETNLEYRRKIYSIFHGAAFVDAGNVWLRNPNPAFPGGHFTKNFLKELAVNGGLGLRLDVSVLILRFDVGIPFRKPWLPESERWVFDKIDFGSGTWRRENIIYGFAIGLPF